jgi:hypothetical protein
MAKKPHLKLNTNKQFEKPVVLKFNYGFPEEEDEKADEPNYFPMAKSFRVLLSNFNKDLNSRIEERNIDVPNHIEYIEILFQSQFDIVKFYQPWFKEFGLLGINFSKFNNQILFAIVDREMFKVFINNVQLFIKKELGEDTTIEYLAKIKFVREFKLLSTSDILKFKHHTELMNVKLIDFPLNDKTASKIYVALENYLKENKIENKLNETTNQLELFGATEKLLKEIAQNFDIVLSITSSLATVVKPSEFNLPERSYGFEIANPNENLPIAGILDTGISTETPLAPIILNDNSFNLTGSSAFNDNANSGSGHGTGIAALTALGRNAYQNAYKGKLKADARLLSMKILDSDSGYLSEKSVLDLLKKAKNKYPAIKIFVLTTCYEASKKYNEDYSTYAFELDKFAHENNAIIFICTANNNEASNKNDKYDLNYFFSEETNLCSPAESMNNLIIGAAAHSLRGDSFEGISTSKEFPTLFSRKSHIDLSVFFSKIKINKSYFKPDVLECGGDYEQSGKYIGVGSKASMEILSAKNKESFYTNSGTSYSAPLTANIALQIQRQYPDISAQSIKALIINGASLNLIRFDKPFSSLLSKTAGHGIVEPERSIFSNENAITFLIEDVINPEEVRIFPIHFPEYLTNMDLGKKRGLLKITATLCFSFLPVLNHQLAYCPIHMAFSFFRNQTGDQILETEESIESKLRSNLGWSQNGRYKGKPIPCSNTQKIKFSVGVKDLLNENSTFKIALNCRINSQLLPGIEVKYKEAHPFSLVISIEEDLPEARLTGHLYSEIEAINELDNISILEAEGDLEA